MFKQAQTAFVFPGQGSQEVGMAADFMDLNETKDIFAEASDVLSLDMRTLMKVGPAETLSLTENTQPALLTASMAVWTYLQKQTGAQVEDMASYVAGHSLGEYSALCAAGVLEFADALRLVRRRGEEMQRAVPPGEGAMAAVLGLTTVDVDSIARNVGCWIANDNSEGQAVYSGSIHDIDEASNLAVMQDAKKVVRLDVSAPFHCPLMEPAAKAMDVVLYDATFRDARVPVILNTTAEPETKGDAMRDALVEQITHTVRWRETMNFMGQQGVKEVYELGSGKVLAGLAKRSGLGLKGVALNTPKQIDELLEKQERNVA